MYEVKSVDLSAVFVKQEISEPSRRINEIVCFSMPPGAVFGLRVGKSPDYITMTDRFSMEPRGDDEANNGLFVRNVTAQPDVLVEIVVVYGGGELSPVV